LDDDANQTRKVVLRAANLIEEPQRVERGADSSQALLCRRRRESASF
jgi:hypothetical protein